VSGPRGVCEPKNSRKDAPEPAARKDARENHYDGAARDARWRAVRRAFLITKLDQV